MLEAKAEVDAVNLHSKIPLHWAVYREHMACTERLLEVSKISVDLPYWMTVCLDRRTRCKAAAVTLYGVLRRRWTVAGERVPRDMCCALAQETWLTRPSAAWDKISK